MLLDLCSPAHNLVQGPEVLLVRKFAQSQDHHLDLFLAPGNSAHSQGLVLAQSCHLEREHSSSEALEGNSFVLGDYNSPGPLDCNFPDMMALDPCQLDYSLAVGDCSFVEVDNFVEVQSSSLPVAYDPADWVENSLADLDVELAVDHSSYGHGISPLHTE